MLKRRRLAAACTGLAVLGGAGFADAAGRAPTPLTPSQGKRVSAKPKTPPLFKVRSSTRGTIVLEVSKSPKRGADGTIDGSEYLRTMNPKGGGLYTKRAESFPDLKRYFLNRPGTYYWQTYRVSCRDEKSADGSDCAVASRKIRKLVVRR